MEPSGGGQSSSIADWVPIAALPAVRMASHSAWAVRASSSAFLAVSFSARLLAGFWNISSGHVVTVGIEISSWVTLGIFHQVSTCRLLRSGNGSQRGGSYRRHGGQVRKGLEDSLPPLPCTPQRLLPLPPLLHHQRRRPCGLLYPRPLHLCQYLCPPFPHRATCIECLTTTINFWFALVILNPC